MSLFIQIAAENLRCCSTALTMQDESARQRRNRKVLEYATFEMAEIRKSMMAPK